MRLRRHLLVALATSFAPVSVGAQGLSDSNLHAYAADRELSQLFVVVHRAGLLSFLGHEHAIVPNEWSSELCLADPVPQGAQASLSIVTDSLVIDSDSARALAHMGEGPGDDDRRDLQRTMLDSLHLDAASFPEIRLRLLASTPADEGRVQVDGTIELHGFTRDISLPVDVERGGDGTLTLAGTLRIRQRDFGIEPESRAGVVKVSNDVDLHFVIVASPTDAMCRGVPSASG